MMQRIILGIFLIAITCGVALAAAPPTAVRDPAVFMSGMEDITAPLLAVPVHPGRTTLDSPLGETWMIGTTYYDYQQNGTFGKQIAVDTAGWVQAVFTYSYNASSTPRQIFYNAWNPQTRTFGSETGVRVDNSPFRAGFCNLAVNRQGTAFSIYHQTPNSVTQPHSACGIDWSPHLGAFTVAELPYAAGNLNIIWPKIACDVDGNLQTVHTETSTGSRSYYAKGIPHYNQVGNGDSIAWPQGFQQWEPASFITMDVAASFHTQKVAVAWINSSADDPLAGNDIYVRISSDAGATWGDVINVTSYPIIDTNCVTNGGEPTTCNGDTMRPWIDLSVLIDQDDVVHVAFSTAGWYHWDEETGDVNENPGRIWSSIWHWDDARQEFNIMAERWYNSSTNTLYINQLMCHRPNLGVDTTNGFLYCSYQMYDTSQWSATNHLQADAWVTVSTSGGRMWSAGTNVTRTDGGQNAAAGACSTEIDINIARFVTDGFIHMQYLLDLDVGSAVVATPVGVATQNPVYYLRIPVDSIPARPYIIPFRNLRVDSTGYPWGLDTNLAVESPPNLLPGQFALYQNYPNPFNPTTTIQFDLASQSTVSLKVFDVLGQEVATLLDRAALPAGTQVVSFDAAGLSSGIYFYRLETSRLSQTRKMVVMK